MDDNMKHPIDKIIEALEELKYMKEKHPSSTSKSDDRVIIVLNKSRKSMALYDKMAMLLFDCAYLESEGVSKRIFSLAEDHNKFYAK